MDFFKLSKIKRPEIEMMKGAQMMGLCFLLVLFCGGVSFIKGY